MQQDQSGRRHGRQAARERTPTGSFDALVRFRPTFPFQTPQALLILTAALAATLLFQTYWYESDFITLQVDWKSVALVVSFVVFLASGFALATGRPLASVALACALMILMTVISVVKYHFLRSTLYALDFYYYARVTELLFLWAHYPVLFLTGSATALAAISLGVLLFRLDDTRIARAKALALLLAATLMLAGSYHWRGDRDKIYHFVGRYHVSAIVASFPEAVEVFRRGGLLEAADRGGNIDSRPDPALQNAVAGETPPTIISILHESSFPTGLFPIQCGGQAPSDLYTSSNGERYELRVETFGGATWLTEYGLLLGISTYYFGEARSFIGYTMQGRVRDSLAMQMRKNGYETLALYPSPKSFVNTESFYKSIGFDRVLDYYDIGAETEYERDQFYFGKAVDAIRAHNASGSKKPLFIFVWTETTHGPYDYTAHPEAAPKPSSICAKDKSWAEYIRRLRLSETDLAWLTNTLKSEFPGRPFMLLGYGDHQPYISQEFLRHDPADGLIPVRNSAGYTTFFRINGVNFEPDFGNVPKSVDTPFLGNVMMQAARLPRHGFYNDRDKLMKLCRGRYNDCPEQSEILSFHQRMVRSSTIVNR